MPNIYTPELISELKRLAAGLPRADGVKALGKRLGLSARGARESYARYVGEGAAVAAAAKSATQAEQEGREDPPKTRGAAMSISGDVGEVTLTDDNPRTLDELLKACEVDLEVWEVEKHTVNKWEVAMREPATTVGGRGSDAVVTESGASIWTRKSHVPLRVPLYQVKAWLRRKVQESTLNKMLERFMGEAKKHAPKRFEFVKPIRAKADCCYVLNGQDLHLAKMAWGVETGHGDWDVKIAREAYDASIDDLISKAPVDRIEEVVIIIGSDMLQVDNDKSMTTAGTYVDSDSRLAKAFDIAADMLVTRIEALASRFRVRAVAISGNHDSTISLFLGKYVSAWFRNHPNVTVDDSPRNRKYYGYGKTLLAFDHGDKTKLVDLPLTIMRENQSTISQYLYTECLTGHLHSEASKDTKGIIVRTAPALCPPDAWHAEKGFVGNMRRSQGLLYQRDNGLQAIFYSKALLG